MICIERFVTAVMGRRCWLEFAELCGWHISKEKSPEPTQKLTVIGVTLNLEDYPEGEASLAVTLRRLQSLEQSILGHLSRGG